MGLPISNNPIKQNPLQLCLTACVLVNSKCSQVDETSYYRFHQVWKHLPSLCVLCFHRPPSPHFSKFLFQANSKCVNPSGLSTLTLVRVRERCHQRTKARRALVDSETFLEAPVRFLLTMTLLGPGKLLPLGLSTYQHSLELGSTQPWWDSEALTNKRIPKPS